MKQATEFPLVHIIILNWNNLPDTEDCINSCRKLSYPDKEIVVVDNGSTDGSSEMLRRKYPELTIIQTESNLGFSGGNNIGIEAAMASGAEYIWLLNNDTVVAPDALHPLVNALENDAAAAMAASFIYYHKSDRIWSAGGSWSPGMLKLRQRGAYSTDSTRYRTNVYIGSASACSLLVRAEAVRQVGMLDDNYFLYWEDTDWCARMLKMGKKILFVPDSKVWHKVSSTATAHSEAQYYYNIRNGLFFCQKHDPRCMPLFLLYVTVDVAVGVLRGNRDMLRGYVGGIRDFLRGRRGVRKP